MDGIVDRANAAIVSPPVLDAEALRLIERFMECSNWLQLSWKPKYHRAIERVRQARDEGRLDEQFDRIWSVKNNAVCNAGRGLLLPQTVSDLREELKELTRIIAVDASPEKYDEIELLLTRWRKEGRIEKVPRVLIGRAFATLHPTMYHTLVKDEMHDTVLHWFSAHTGFHTPAGSWAHKAQALTQHLSAIVFFDRDSLERNLFPWYVFEHLRSEGEVVPFKAGHTSRASTACVDLPATQREIVLRHNKLQDELYRLLNSQYQGCVGTEQPSGSGGYVDALVRFADGRCFLYEIKVALTAASAIRQAVGQLLEYAYRPTGLEPEKLIIVAEPPLDSDTARYLQRMNAEFGLKLEYLRLTLPNDESIDRPLSGITRPT